MILEIKNVTEAEDFFQNYIKTVSYDQRVLFRGLSLHSYKLIPSISQIPLKSAVELIKREEKILSEFHTYAIDLSEKGILAIANNNNENINNWHHIAQMQHLEIPTRLMDWTLRWEIALFFCVNRNEDDDGVVWIFKTPETSFLGPSSIGEISPYLIEKYFMINVEIMSDNYETYLKRIAERRRARQQGKFLIQSYKNSILPAEENPLFKDLLERIKVPARYKINIKEELRQRGITEETIMVERNINVETSVKTIKSNL